MARFLHFSMALYKLKQQGMTHKMIEQKLELVFLLKKEDLIK